MKNKTDAEKINAIKREFLDNDDRFFKEVFVGQIYAPTRELGKLGTVIDLGALHGEFSLYIYDLADKIHAVEPQQDAYIGLQRCCEGLKKIKTHKLIISNSNGYKYIEGTNDGGATTKDMASDNVPKVECKTLATFMKDNNIEKVDVLKVDIESHEPYVFGSDDFPQVASKIKYIIGEHDKDLEKILTPLGFTFTRYSHGFIFKR